MLTGELSSFHAVLGAWFQAQFGEATEVQRSVWREIQHHDHLLIAAPTGSGKTLAALMPCLERIIRGKEQVNTQDELKKGVKLLYVTPLKALNNDVHHHMLQFADEMEQVAVTSGLAWPGLRIGIRTGDTPQRVRAAMLRQPPDVLITTPESLYLLLTSPKSREILKTVEQVIIDEIHSLAGDARGMHLSVTLERLVALTGRSLQRIGVSATQRPIELVAQFMGGWERSAKSSDTADEGNDLPRRVGIIESAMDKTYRVSVMLPDRTVMTNNKEEIWAPLVERLQSLMKEHRTTLIFANNRRLCERLTRHLNLEAGMERARAHHGSMSRENRLEVERALKAGELSCLVATSSLELGIDIGHIDLVIQIDAPPSTASGIQRIGRAGHAVGDISRGTMIARSRGILSECAVQAHLITQRQIEAITIPSNDLGILSQQIVAMVASEAWSVEQLYAVLKGSDSYRSLTLERLHDALRVLSGYFPFVRPLFEWNQALGMLSPTRTTMMSAIMGAGTIPQSTSYPIHHAQSRLKLGELEEEYIYESRIGDVFQLGTSSWRIQSIKNDRVYVVEAANEVSEIPFWRAEASGRSFELSCQIGRFHQTMASKLETETKEIVTAWLMQDYGMDASAAEQLVGYMRSQLDAAPMPTDRRIIVEHYQDDHLRHHLVIHSWFGKRLNRTWQLVLQISLERLFNVHVNTSLKDNGIEFILPDWDVRVVQSLFSMPLHKVEELLVDAIPASPLFGMTFRRIAETSLLLPRSFTRTPAWKQRLRSQELLRAAVPHAAQFPFIEETMQVCLYELLDLHRLKQLLSEIHTGTLELVIDDRKTPSPFAWQFALDSANNQMYESDAIGKDIQLHLLSINRDLAGEMFSASLLPAPSADMLKEEQAIQSSQDLWTYLKRKGDLSTTELIHATRDAEETLRWTDELVDAQRIQSVSLQGAKRWICSDEVDTYAKLTEDTMAAAFVLERYMERELYFMASQLVAAYGLSTAQVDKFIEEQLDQERIEPAPFQESEKEMTWMSRTAAERAIRKASGQLRKQVEPVEAPRYGHDVCSRHDLYREDQEQGPEGLRNIIARMQGLFLPLAQWETSIFPARMQLYRKEWLDQLCAEGEVIWLGRREAGEKEGRVAFFLAESKPLYTPLCQAASAEIHPQLVELMRSKGASFLTALSREMAFAPSEIMDLLIDLVWAGVVSNDQFSPLRLHGSKPAKSQGAFKSGLGRWYLLESIADSELPMERSAAAWIEHLLDTYLILTKETAAMQSIFVWDQVYDACKQLEQMGMLTRGFWIKGVDSLQFAKPETLEQLQLPVTMSQDRIAVLTATDPMNLYGLLLDWPDTAEIQFTRRQGNVVVLLNGRCALWIENKGKRVVTLGSDPAATLPSLLNKPTMQYIIQRFIRLTGARKWVIETWDGQAVEASPVAALLRELGAIKDQHAYVIWSSSVN
ncbi:DEAD/DEAH box helicase [Paenibacillus guangzhouensis]|uniref:DEAD/DEAH box helicase n=1 Tax=Paenibacillus guangzhouensis TaxID=1473112 RepID=UPI0012674E94|nr:DEAD/DEAH box helicase [Paenibacillus guangzhouensis]